MVALILLACAHKPPDVDLAPRGFQPTDTTEQALAGALAPRRVAILVGVDAYDDPVFPDLHWAGADANALGETLGSRAAGGFDDVAVLAGSANRAEVLDALVLLREQVKRRDTVVVYFSGHGTRVPDGATWRHFLLVSDTRSANLEDTALDLEALEGFFSALPAAQKALIVDACFNGDGKSVLRPEHLDLPDPSPLTPPTARLGLGEAWLFATSAGRPSLESDSLGHGVYTGHLLEALSWGFAEADTDGDGLLTAWEAHDHARKAALAYTDGAQVPEAAIRVVGEADVVLAGDPDKRRARQQALLYAYGRGALASSTVFVDGRERGVLPGTLAIAPGNHHFMLVDPAGTVQVDGTGRLEPGRSYRADDLARVVQGPDRMLTAQFTGATSGPLSAVVGAGAAGFELSASRRRTEIPLKGGYLRARLGMASAPDRADLGDARRLTTGGLDAGWQADAGRWRLRAGLGATVAFIPPDPVAGAPQHSTAGWWLAAGGPSVGMGFALGRGWTTVLDARLHWALLDADGAGVEPVPWGGVGLGVEWDL